jgi:hypothetical protein
MIMGTIKKDSSMIINIQIKERVIIFRAIDILIDKKEVEVEAEVVIAEAGVEVGGKEVVIVDIEIEISIKEIIQILIRSENLMIIINNSVSKRDFLLFF